MKYLIALMLIFGANSALSAEDGFPEGGFLEQSFQDNESEEEVLKTDSRMRITVVGQGVAPSFTTSPAQAFALAKRSAVVEAYRMIAERVNGVKIEGQDTIKNMMVKRTSIRTHVAAMIRNANILETNFTNGMCEVEMEVVLSHNQFN